VSAIWRYDNIDNLTSKILIDTVCNAVVAVGEDSLSFKASEIGTHSIRSGAAMQMYLGKCPIYTIMLIGRWSSNALLQYMRKQIEKFSHNISHWILTFMSHRHIPDMKPRCVSHLDPRQWNNPNKPRQGEILVVTWLAKLSFHLSLSLHERWLMTISGGSMSCRSGLG
jgi:hypothetical protein